jgi:hypothetical protein
MYGEAGHFECEQIAVSANFYVSLVDTFRRLGDPLIKKVITFSFRFCGEYRKHGVTIQRQRDLVIISAEYKPFEAVSYSGGSKKRGKYFHIYARYCRIP